jgi:glycosyltransferase involved in cell wall biosynthesis
VDGETGLLCPPGDPVALAQRLVEALSDPERLLRMGSAGRERHDSLFTVDRMVARTAELYDRLVA